MFGVSVLASTQRDISDHFANRSVRGVKPLFERLHDLPVIAGAAAQVAATLHHVYPCGGHTLYVGRVVALHLRAERPEPLLFHGGRYGVLASPER